MKSYHVRMYHPFPAMRSWEHLAAIAGIVVVPLLMFVGFSLFTGIALPSVFENLGVSIYRIVTALIISIVLGWTAAVLFYHGPRSKVALPAFDVLQSLPTSATLPIATLYLGPSDATVIIFLVFTIVWPMFFTVVSSLKQVRKDWVEAVQMSRISGFDYIRLFLVPVSVPGLVTGTIIGLGEGWEALIATELIVHAPRGLGSFFDSFSTDIWSTTFGILALLAVIFAVNKLIWLPLLEWSHTLIEE